MDTEFTNWIKKQPVGYLQLLFKCYQASQSGAIPVIKIENNYHIDAFVGADDPIGEEEITQLEEELTKHGIKRIIGH